MNPEVFIAKWRTAKLKERSVAQEHFIDLCREIWREDGSICPRIQTDIPTPTF